MNNEFLIVKNIKLFINLLDDIIIPNRDRLLKDKLYNTSYYVLYLVYRANYEKDKDNRYNYIKDILSSISILDFYLERCFKNKYINIKLCNKLSNELLTITKMIYAWSKYENKCK